MRDKTLSGELLGVAALALVLAAVSPRAAYAQGEEPTQGMQDEARSLFEAGRVAFNEGRYQNALDYFERSYELSGKPQLLYNIGAAADRLRMDEKALESFKAYLKKVPDAPNRSEVKSRIRVLEKVVSGERSREEVEPGPGANEVGGAGEGDGGGDGGESAPPPPPPESGDGGEQEWKGSAEGSASTQGSTGTPGSAGAQGSGTGEQPTQPEPQKPSLEAGFNGVLHTAFLGSAPTVARSFAGTYGVAGRFEIPIMRFIAIGGFVRLSYWDLRDTPDGDSNWLFESGPMVKGGFPIGLSDTLTLTPYGILQLGWTFSGLDHENADQLRAGQRVAAGWNVALLAGTEMLIGGFRVFAELGYTRHNANHDLETVSGIRDLDFGSFTMNAGLGVAF